MEATKLALSDDGCKVSIRSPWASEALPLAQIASTADDRTLNHAG